MEVEEASAKVRSGPPDDDGSTDAALDVWAGEIPVVTSYGAPVASPGLRPGIPLDASIRRLLDPGRQTAAKRSSHARSTAASDGFRRLLGSQPRNEKED
jgi:hypothetical protein